MGFFTETKSKPFLLAGITAIAMALLFLSLGCVQTPATQPTPSPTAAASASITPSPTPSPTPTPRASPTPSPTPTQLPSPSAAPSGTGGPGGIGGIGGKTGAESLETLVANVQDAASKTLGRNVVLEKASDGYYAEAAITNAYRSEIVVRTSPYNAWDSFDSPQAWTSATGKQKQVSTTKNKMGVTVFEAKMPCYDWKYVITFKITEGAITYVGYGENLIAALIDVCP